MSDIVVYPTDDVVVTQPALNAQAVSSARRVEVVEHRPLTQVQLHFVNTVEEAGNLMRWLSTVDRVAVDTEGTGLDKRKDHARLVQIGDDMHGWSIPVQDWGGVYKEIVAKYEGLYDFHNAPYDWWMLHNSMGVQLPKHRIHDTRQMAHQVDSTGSIALKNLARKLVHPMATAGQSILDDQMRENGWTWATVPVDLPAYWQYGALDTVLTTRVRQQLEPKVMAHSRVSYELEMAAMWVFDRVELRGARIDRPYTKQFIDTLNVYATQVAEWIKVHFGIEKPGSDVQIMNALLASGVDLTKKTKSGARYSVDKEVLASITHPLASAVSGYRQAKRLIGTYLETYLRLSEEDGFIYPSINTIGGSGKNPFEPGGDKGVRTGRMSMSDPNLQNVPVRTKEGARIRNCFVPREEHTWLKIDADQIEMRILAHVTEDQGLINAFRSPDDFFVVLARDLFGEPDFKKSDPRRQMVKNGGYAKIYAAGIETFSATAGVSEADGADFMAKFDKFFPGINRHQKDIERAAKLYKAEHGTLSIRCPLTGRLHTADASREYALGNYEIQGAAAAVFKQKAVECDAAGLTDFMLFPVHDELDFDVPNDQVSDVEATLMDVMNDDTMLRVPVTWSIGLGDRWGNAKD